MALRLQFVAGLFTLLVSLARVHAQDVDEIVMREAFVVEGVASSGRVLLFTDAVEAMRVAGTWTPPKPGDSLPMPDGTTKDWKQVKAGDDGWLGLRGGSYAVWRVESAEERVMILDAAGHGNVLVNGELRTGDPYENGYVKLPVLLKKGENELVFRGGRGRVRAKLTPPLKEVYLTTDDMTMPDLLDTQDHAGAQFGSMLLVNASRRPLHWTLTSSGPTWHLGNVEIKVEALSVRKVLVPLGKPPAGAANVEVSVFASALHGVSEFPGIAPRITFTLPVRSPSQPHKRTFISDIDGSVQYYSVVPIAPNSTVPDADRGLVLSLHGASVEATNQAAAYSPKDWCHIVCPTNRRPFGFDWEDWGRLDALEVLADAQKHFKHNPARTYLTGHSMGGHGTWQLGAHFPGLFAAIAPSAGWSTFGSYGGGPPNVYEQGSPPQQMLRRASSASDTLALARNYVQNGVYILHGDADDNVPVTQARAMKKILAEFHPNFAYYERAGAGHWWGNECVDWPPIFDFFKRNVKPDTSDVRRVEFTTASPTVSPTCDWVTIHQAQKWFEPCKVDLTFDKEKATLTGTTQNVAMLSIDRSQLSQAAGDVTVTLDGQSIRIPSLLRGHSPDPNKGWWHRVALVRNGDTWRHDDLPVAPLAVANDRGFKSAFRNHLVLIYATQGTPDENAWSLAKARFDAESFWYRGNGSIEIISDADYVAQRRSPSTQTSLRPLSDRNAILYGNMDTNAAWAILLPLSPIKVTRTSVQCGDQTIVGDNLACLITLPAFNAPGSSVGVVAGTGIAGCRLTDRLPIFVSGVGIPDWVVLSTDMLSDTRKGLLGAGYFGNDWSIQHSDSAWLDQPADSTK